MKNIINPEDANVSQNINNNNSNADAALSENRKERSNLETCAYDITRMDYDHPESAGNDTYSVFRHIKNDYPFTTDLGQWIAKLIDIYSDGCKIHIGCLITNSAKIKLYLEQVFNAKVSSDRDKVSKLCNISMTKKRIKEIKPSEFTDIILGNYKAVNLSLITLEGHSYSHFESNDAIEPYISKVKTIPPVLHKQIPFRLEKLNFSNYELSNPNVTSGLE